MKEQVKCPICHELSETGNILFEGEDPVTGWAQCLPCRREIEKGQVALVEADRLEEGEFEDIPVPSTGNYRFMSMVMFNEAFEMDIPEEALGMVFVEKEVYRSLQEKHRLSLN